MILSDTPAITIGEAGFYALLGYAVVFFGLILLMLLVMAIGSFFIAADKKKKEHVVEVVETPAPVEAPTAPGAAGDLKLYNVEPKTAAMLMAIVADKLGKPLNELRFLSIREVEE